jgi:hypothetical protein
VEAILRGLSLALDGVRDSISEVEEDIEEDQANMAYYQRAALEERYGLRILDPRHLSRPRNRAGGGKSKSGKHHEVEEGISASSPHVAGRVKEWAEREGCESDGDPASEEEYASGSSPHPSSTPHDPAPNQSPLKITDESDCEIEVLEVEETQSSPVSSAGLTNTSDEYSD